MPEPKPETNQTVLPTRRNFLSAAAIGTGALIASTSISSAFLFRSAPPVKLTGLPASWVEAQGNSLDSYAQYLQSLDLKQVTIQQVISAHAKNKGSVWNSLPPRSMWRNLGATLVVADKIAITLNRPVKEVTSAYRSPAYNRRCAGAKSRSYHMSNVALDLQFAASPSSVASVARQLRSHGYFKGGIGRYRSFTHVDTRGTNVDW